MLCREVERLLAEYAEDALPAARGTAIDAHLAGCAACANELAALRRSVAALNAAGRQATPDLWSGIQARIERESVLADCAAIRELLPGYRDADLERAAVQRVRLHLAACAACEQEEQSLAAPLRSLERCASPADAPDLWPRIAARLGETLSCSEAETLLPAHLAGEPRPQGLALRLHLENCAACAQSAVVFEQALRRIDLVGRCVPRVDLWPAFTERLRCEQERASRRPSLAQAVGVAAAWLRGPLRQPALGLAAFVALAVVGQLLTSPDRGPQTARVIEPRRHTPVAEAPPTPAPQGDASDLTTQSVKRGAPATLAEGVPAAPRTARNDSPSARVDNEATETRRTDDSAPERTMPVPEVRVAFNLPASNGAHEALVDGPFGSPPAAGANPDRVSEKDGMAAVVLAVEILAGREDVLDRPFDAQVNE